MFAPFRSLGNLLFEDVSILSERDRKGEPRHINRHSRLSTVENSDKSSLAKMDNAVDDDGNELSQYELQRLERIKKNEAYLESIGLGTAKQKMKDMCRATKRNANRPKQNKIVNPGEERRSKRLKSSSSSNAKDDEHVMLSYHDDDDLAVVKQRDDRRLYQYDEDEDASISPSYRPTRRVVHINRSDFELSEEEKLSLQNNIDDNYLYKFKEFLVFHNKISEQNVRNVMRQVSKLARGEGVRYESPKYGWAPGRYFMKGTPVTPLSDIVQLMVEAQECENKWGRDHGNGWLLSHPLKKMLLFQQFCLNNPDFLTTKCKLAQYYALDDDDLDCTMEAATTTTASVTTGTTSSDDDEDEDRKVAAATSKSTTTGSTGSSVATTPNVDDKMHEEREPTNDDAGYALQTKVIKNFDGKPYEGYVSQYDDVECLFQVTYEDGDKEELNLQELDQIVVKYPLSTKVAKEFDDGKTYQGEVTAYNPDTKLYQITYEDDDQEEVDQVELNSIVLKKDTLKGKKRRNQG